LSQFDAVADRIFGEEPSAAGEFDGILQDWKATGTQSPLNALEIIDDERGMCLFGRLEVVFHTKVQLLRTALEPGTAARGQRLRLRDL
jgi:hypothetical protein